MNWNKAANKVKETLKLSDVKSKQVQNAIDLSEIDVEIFHDMVDTYDSMQDNINAGLQEYAPFTNLSEDIYGSLYKRNPKLNEVGDMTPFTQFNHGLMDSLMESDQFESLHRNTKFDQLSSAIATEVLQDAAMKEIISYKQELMAKKNGQSHDTKKASAGEVIDNLNEQGKVQEDIDGLLGGRSPGELSGKEAKELAEYQQKLMDLQDEIMANTQGAQQLANGVQDATQKAIKQAAMDVAEIKDIIDAWGLEAGEHVRISVDERRAAIERVRRSPRLKKLTDIVGRMKKIAQEKKKKKLPEGHSIENVETGRKLESALPSELLKLAHPVTKKDFYNKYQSGQLLQYKKSDTQRVGQGPIIFCHDKSGSMMGERDDWATALALAMLETAQKEKRNYAYIPYESKIIASHVLNIVPGEIDPQNILNIAELGSGGGTNFMEPLREALECLNSNVYKKGDIVFVTDGESHVSDDFLKNFLSAKEQKQFYVNSVIINAGGGQVSKASLEKFSDSITTISDLADLDNDNTLAIFRIADDKDKFSQTPATDATAPTP